jgi:alkylation response protein AidB-like acyl-CoA dehydrogenase
MCLTEPQSGTDLGLVVTKATAQDDGSYRITGTKIFISAGDHDLTENILHLVLARLPNAPPGTKGLSLFLAPKYLPTAEGNPGERNAVSCSAIEHKMGIHACSTCVLHFENTQAWLVGAPNGGMQAMFAMMNSTRLAAGVQGLGLSEVAYQNAFLHARERLQGRRMGGVVNPDHPADPILVHPDIRKNLLTVKATTEGIRALIAWVAFNLDFAAVAPDEAQRQQADDLVQLLTPVVKAFGSDIGFDNVNLALQVFGGYGYIRETGMEQLVRDARITQIYEGTNGVQALDLIGRKLGAHRGRYPQTLIDTIQKLLDETRGNEAMTEFCKPLDQALDRLRHGLMIVARNAAADPAEAGAAATDLLRLFGYVTLGFMWARMAKLALAQLDAESDDRAFYESKLATARFYMHKLLLPQCDALLNSIRAGGSTLLTFDDTWFLTS